MTRLRFVATLVAALGLALGAAACGGDDGGTGQATGTDTGTGTTGEVTKGGTYRVDVESAFDFTDAFDPTGEYTALGWSFYTTMLRPLMTYRHVAGAEGNEPIPDLAAAEPEVSEDGLTYTFTLRDGVKFAPPVNREVTSQDVAYAFNRLANPTFGGAGYPLYYQEIEGFTAVGEGTAKTVSGITTPDDKTIVFKLTKPVGDFLYRLAMPATAPIPQEVAKCAKKAGDYGRYVIANGPYMVEGTDKLDISSCGAIKPVSGYNPEAFLNLVRNPNYDPATENPEARENNVDRFEFNINSNVDDCFNKVKEALIDDTLCGETAKQTREYTQNEDLKDNLKLNPDDSTFYLSMNLTTPPFDDVNVRRAVNYATDKVSLIRAWGGPVIGEPATHILPPSLVPESLADYDPYATTDHLGDIEKAKAEMAKSKYDTDQDGVCDAPECKDVLHIIGNTGRERAMVPVIEDFMGKIGITLKTRLLDDQYSVILDPTKKTPFASGAGWGKDYPDAFTFFFYLFDGRVIPKEPGGVTYNEPLVGITPEVARSLGIELPAGGVPSVDADIDNCVGTADDAARLECWGELDRKLMEEVVPWVPYIWRNNSTIIADSVSQWVFDQSTGNQSWTRVAVDESKQK
jgi:peptide/nickel transport system substrate-binding protein